MSAASTPSRPPAQQLDEKRKTQSKATDRVCALECASWLPTILPDIPTPAADASSDDKYEFFFNSLTSGVILCRLVAAATKGEVAPKYKDAKAGSFIARDNVTNALSALRSPPLSLRPEVVCETDDLVDRKNERAFVNMLLIFSKICMIKYGTEAPAMVKFELEIDEEHAEQGATEGADGEKKAAPLTTDTGAGKDAVEENVEEEHAWVPPPTPKKKTSTVTNDSPAPAATIITTTPPPAAAAAAPAAAPAPAAAASAPAAEAASSSLAAPSGSGSRSRTPSSSTPGHSHQLSQGGAAHPPSEIDLAIAEVLEDHDWLWLSVKKIQILNKQKRKAAARGGKGEYKFGSVGGKVAVRVVQGEAMVREKNEWIDLVTYLKEKIVPHEKH